MFGEEGRWRSRDKPNRRLEHAIPSFSSHSHTHSHSHSHDLENSHSHDLENSHSHVSSSEKNSDNWLMEIERQLQQLESEESLKSRHPDILVIQVGLHTCFHAFAVKPTNTSMIEKHTNDISRLMDSVKNAVERVKASGGGDTMVIFQTSGRVGNSEPRYDRCSWIFNRKLVHEAHKAGFAVMEREEIERRLLYKSEYHALKYLKAQLHIEAPSPQIVGTALVALISCLERHRRNIAMPS